MPPHFRKGPKKKGVSFGGLIAAVRWIFSLHGQTHCNRAIFLCCYHTAQVLWPPEGQTTLGEHCQNDQLCAAPFSIIGNRPTQVIRPCRVLCSNKPHQLVRHRHVQSCRYPISFWGAAPSKLCFSSGGFIFSYKQRSRCYAYVSSPNMTICSTIIPRGVLNNMAQPQRK